MILRFIFGFIFILSGGIKLIDPIGTSLVVEEYLKAAHISFLSPMSTFMGITLSLLEFCVGVATLMKIRIKEASIVGLIMMIGFTLISIILLIFDPIESCGCFGQAMPLTHTQTFVKNIILLICIIPIYIKRDSLNHQASKCAQWIFISIYATIALTISIISLVRMPIIEFGNFSPGTDLSIKLSESQEMQQSYSKSEFEFIYEKDENKQSFTLDNLPDSTWTFVESVEHSEKRSSGKDKLFEFYITDISGEAITESLINKESPLLIVSIHDFEDYYTPSRWTELALLKEEVINKGGDLWILTSATPDMILSTLGYSPFDEINFGFIDYKTAITLHRSNGGYLYIRSGFVVDKWSRRGFSKNKLSVIEKDFDIVMMHYVTKRQLTYLLSIVVIILSIIIIGKVSDYIASKRMAKIRASS